MAIISFLNIGVIVLLVNLKISKTIPLPILQGKYEEFSVEWYRLVGSSLCVQLIIMLLSNNFTNLFYWFLAFMRRCCDRSCRCSRKHTKKLSQGAYESVNFGGSMDIEYRYANMLVVIFLVMMYGPGIPIMYLIAAVYFFVTYWTEKLMIFYNYR